MANTSCSVQPQRALTAPPSPGVPPEQGNFSCSPWWGHPHVRPPFAMHQLPLHPPEPTSPVMASPPLPQSIPYYFSTQGMGLVLLPSPLLPAALFSLAATGLVLIEAGPLRKACMAVPGRVGLCRASHGPVSHRRHRPLRPRRPFPPTRPRKGAWPLPPAVTQSQSAAAPPWRGRALTSCCARSWTWGGGEGGQRAEGAGRAVPQGGRARRLTNAPPH